MIERRPRCRLLAFTFAFCLLAGAQGTVANAADDAPYPNRPIHFVLPFGAGTQLDIAARLVGGKLAEALRQPVIVENNPGASGNIASELVAKAPADGYTLLFTGSLVTLLPSVMGARAVDPVLSFAPVAKLGEPPLVILVHPSLGVNTLPELLARAKREPGKIAYATPGVGTLAHLVASVIARSAGIELIHVPYANGGQALKDVLTGEVPVYFTFLGAADAHIRSGQLKVLAVASSRRMGAWPDVPTVVELGFKDAAADPWNGVLAPAGTPSPIVDLLNRELARIVQLPDVRERFMQMGMDPMSISSDQFRAEIKDAAARWPSIAKAAGIVAD